MYKILTAIVATLVMASFATLLFAAETAKPAPSGTTLASESVPAANAAAKRRVEKQNERNMKAKSLTAAPKSSAPPATPAVRPDKPVAPEPAAKTAKPAPAADAAAKKRAADKLSERNKKAKALSDTLKKTETPPDPAAK